MSIDVGSDHIVIDTKLRIGEEYYVVARREFMGGARVDYSTAVLTLAKIRSLTVDEDSFRIDAFAAHNTDSNFHLSLPKNQHAFCPTPEAAIAYWEDCEIEVIKGRTAALLAEAAEAHKGDNKKRRK